MYVPQSSDTGEEADRIQFEMLRQMSPQERLETVRKIYGWQPDDE